MRQQALRAKTQTKAFVADLLGPNQPIQPPIATYHNVMGTFHIQRANNQPHPVEILDANFRDFPSLSYHGYASNRSHSVLRGGSRLRDDPRIRAFLLSCNNTAALHALSGQISSGPTSMRAREFLVLLVDTGCSKASTGGLQQYKAYCEYAGSAIIIDDTRRAQCNVGIGSAISIGIARISFPFPGDWMSIDVHLVDNTPPRETIPILISLADRDCLQILFENTVNLLVRKPECSSEPVTLINDHQFYR